VEAQAAGRPVVAFAAGGALDTVIDGQTGVHFNEQRPEALVAAVRRLETLALEPARIVQNARRFETSVFRAQLTAFVNKALAARAASNTASRVPSAPVGGEPIAVT
jgi:glycosyltransferase involved in cell wall biosynthesis